MQNELLIAVGAGLAGMFGWGLADFFAKKTIDRIGDVASLVWAHVFGSMIFALVFLFQTTVQGVEISFSPTASTWLGLFFFGVLQTFVYYFVYKAFGKGKLAVLNPIFASYSGLVALFSVLFFGELMSASLLIAVGIIFGGVLLLNLDFRALRSYRLKITEAAGVNEMLIAVVLATVWTLGWDRFVQGNNATVFALYMYVWMSVSAICIARIQKVKLMPIPASLWKFLALIGLCEMVAYVGISVGYSLTSLTSIVAVLSGAFSLPTIVLARVFLKERITPIQTIGSLIIVLGILILALR